jgi:PhzF family phenazine biosynthesis protein
MTNPDKPSISAEILDTGISASAFTLDGQGGNPSTAYFLDDISNIDLQAWGEVVAGNEHTEDSVIGNKEIDGVYPIRFITPAGKTVPTCVHGTFVAARAILSKSNENSVTFKYLDNGSKLQTITREGNNYYITFEDGSKEMEIDARDAANVLNLEIDKISLNSPSRVFSVGSPKAIVYVDSNKTLEEIVIDFETLNVFQVKYKCNGIYVLSTEKGIKNGGTVRARQWNTALRSELSDGTINFEDPKTGIALGALGYYFSNVLNLKNFELRIDQGPRDRKPGVLLLKISDGVLRVGAEVV